MSNVHDGCPLTYCCIHPQGRSTVDLQGYRLALGLSPGPVVTRIVCQRVDVYNQVGGTQTPTFSLYWMDASVHPGRVFPEYPSTWIRAVGEDHFDEIGVCANAFSGDIYMAERPQRF